MRESDFRELAGFGPELEIGFAGQQWKLREGAGLAALIRFSRNSRSDNPEEPVPLSVIYRLFEDTIIDFETFGLTAFETKADGEEISALIGEIAARYCARSQWSAMRLIGYVADNLAELDGKLILAGGRGIISLSPREACDVALAACLEGREDEDREIFLEELEYSGDPASEALAQLRAFQAAQKEAAGGG